MRPPDYWNYRGLRGWNNQKKTTSIEDEIQELINKGYTQAAFSKKSNADKFIKMWKEQKDVKDSRIVRTNGPTIEEPNKKVNAYYVMIDV